MLKITKEMVKENIELLEEANDVKNGLLLLSQITINPIDALNNHIEGSTNDERIKNVKNIIDGINNPLTTSKALVLAKEYAKDYLKEELSECVEELNEITKVKDSYITTLEANYASLTEDTTIEDFLSTYNEMPLARMEYIVNKLNENISLLISESGSVNQISINQFIIGYLEVISNLSVNLSNLKETIDRLNNDLLLNTAYTMYKDDIPYDDIVNLLNVEPIEPTEPTDTATLIDNVIQENIDDVSINDLYNVFMEITKLVLAKIKEVESTINDFKDTAKIDNVISTIETLHTYILNQAEPGMIEDKAYSLITILQYVYNNITNVSNLITNSASNINNNIIVLDEAYNLNKKIFNK